jgi:hypothetical protein
MGGIINQFISTEYSYWSKKTIDEIREQAENTFMIGVERSKKDKFHVDPKFLKESTLRPYKYYGGAFPEFDDNWNPWSQSILTEQNLVCTNWESLPITDFLDLDHRTIAQKDNIHKALSLYLNKPACNHIVQSAKEPHMSIMKIGDVNRCSNVSYSSWWLVSGADNNGRCLVSWAYLTGTSNKIVGQTQHMRTDFSKVDTCLRGKIFRDSKTCASGLFAGSNVTFILKDPQGWLHYEHINACAEPIDRSHDFKICPKKDRLKNDENHISDLEGISYTHVNHGKFSIKNNCKTPYCSKLVSGWTPMRDETFKVLGFLTVDKKYFDPIVDPDLVNFKVKNEAEESKIPEVEEFEIPEQDGIPTASDIEKVMRELLYGDSAN